MGKARPLPFRVKVSSKGQVVIPKPLREACGIHEGSEVVMIAVEEGILIRVPKAKGNSLRGLLADLSVDIEECERILARARKSLLRTRA